MRLDPDIAQKLYDAAHAVIYPGDSLTRERIDLVARALDAAEANDEANRRVARAAYDEDWLGVIVETLRAKVPSLPMDTAAGAVFSALREAGVEFPDRGRRPAPQTLEEHLEEAARLLEMSLTHDETGPGGYHVWDDHCRAQVGAAEVHARIAHAGSALMMLGRAEQPAQDAPGLAALEKLAAAVEQLAAGEGVLTALQGIARALTDAQGREGAWRVAKVEL